MSKQLPDLKRLRINICGQRLCRKIGVILLFPEVCDGTALYIHHNFGIINIGQSISREFEICPISDFGGMQAMWQLCKDFMVLLCIAPVTSGQDDRLTKDNKGLLIIIFHLSSHNSRKTIKGTSARWGKCCWSKFAFCKERFLKESPQNTGLQVGKSFRLFHYFIYFL